MNKNRAFTLIELLIVVGLIAILAGVVFVALDPFTRFRDARNARRAADVASIASAIRVHQVDNGGNYIASVAGLTNATSYMIVTNTGNSCIVDALCSGTSNNCADLSGLSNGGYLGAIPISPKGAAAAAWGSGKTGYYIRKNSNNSITVGACESEGAAAIEVTR